MQHSAPSQSSNTVVDMELPLTPLAFAARARRLYANRDATVFEGVISPHGLVQGEC
jgi:hypothetical protein